MKKEYRLTLCRYDDDSVHPAIAPSNSYLTEGSEVLIGTKDGEIHAIVEWARAMEHGGYFDDMIEEIVLLMSYVTDIDCLDKISAVIYKTELVYEEEEDDAEGNCAEAFEEA